MSLLLLASRLGQAFLLLLVSSKFLMISCVAGLSAIADAAGVTSGVVGVSAVSFKHSVACGPAVTVFPAVDGILADASIPADPGVHIFAAGFTYWILY